MVSNTLLIFVFCFLFFRSFAFLCNSRQHIFIHFPPFIVENEYFGGFYRFCDWMMKHTISNFVHFILVISKNWLRHYLCHRRHFD
ncbi:hypothetical protein PBCV1_a252aL [Paramecium bursaria Chlorella virus 1]|uniref:Uncharacterized protein n=1 Tax=Paramecium bursaria Chlorella virus 1 TaxID=10506 RepID=A0AA97PWD4_PBCV1|nr:hypothetical protein PBCV1_a252aL [Paramecium bursaria Chlorella virus 1]AAC96620.2 hypothetical protein [Paramecium bursaria Chlorella virus 1]